MLRRIAVVCFALGFVLHGRAQEQEVYINGSDTLDYQLTAYLDTSVGNPYMYQQLVADFYWWVADSEELAPPTGDTMQPLLWGAAVLVSGAALTVLLRRRREVSHD